MKSLLIGFIAFFIISASLADEEIITPLYVDHVDVITSEIIINDTYYRIDVNMKVFDKNGNLVSKSTLKKGQQVSFEFSPYKSGPHKQIASITIQSDK